MSSLFTLLAVLPLLIACHGSRPLPRAPFDPVGVWEAVPDESVWRSEGGSWHPVDAAYVSGETVSFLRDGTARFTLADSMRGSDEVVQGWEHVLEEKAPYKWRVLDSRVEVRRAEQITHTFAPLRSGARLVSDASIPGYVIRKVWRRRE